MDHGDHWEVGSRGDYSEIRERTVQERHLLEMGQGHEHHLRCGQCVERRKDEAKRIFRRRQDAMSEMMPLLNVEDVRASTSFYSRALGAVVDSQWEHEGRVRWARIRFDGGVMMLNEPDGASSSHRRGRAEFSDVVLYVMCYDAAETRQRLADAGLPVGELSREDYGNDEFAVRDPDGYAIRFSSPR